MTSPNAFSPTDLAASIENFNTELLLLALHANTLNDQPDIFVHEVPGLPQHQELARETAQYLFTDLAPDFAGINSDIIGFANQFLAASQHLREDANVIDDATASPARRRASATDFATGLRMLSRRIERTQPHRAATAGDLDSLGLRLEQNTAALDGDLTLAKRYLAEGTLASLEAQLAAVQNALARDNATIAQGAVKGLVAALKITIGIATAYESPGTGIKLAISGFEGAVAVGQEQQTALADIHQQFNAYKDLMARVANAQVAWAGVQNVSHAAGSMAIRQNTTKTALEGITRSWNDMSQRLHELAHTLTSTDVPANLALGAQVTAAESAWRNLKNAIVRWQSDGGTVTPVRQMRLF